MSDRSAAVSLSRSEWRVGEVIEDLYEPKGDSYRIKDRDLGRVPTIAEDDQ
jgi:hypothetical protein